ncbi:hypothetical protein CF204P1_27230 [Citrobacter freundii]|nr:hypothetical protein CF204P1_27230 [Citrobacter freundii]
MFKNLLRKILAALPATSQTLLKAIRGGAFYRPQASYARAGECLISARVIFTGILLWGKSQSWNPLLRLNGYEIVIPAPMTHG